MKVAAAAAATRRPQLARKTFIGDGNLEMLERRARFDDRKGHQPGDHQGHDGNDYHRPKTQGRHAESGSGSEHGHGAGNLPACRLSGNCLETVTRCGRPRTSRRRLRRWRRSLETGALCATCLEQALHGHLFSLSLPRTVALVGLMGAGKSAIGKRLAAGLGLPFVDADDEIERAAGCSIAEILREIRRDSNSAPVNAG